jgi:hypothetical protein
MTCQFGVEFLRISAPLNVDFGMFFGGTGRARTDDDRIMSSEAMTGRKTTYACLRWQL